MVKKKIADIKRQILVGRTKRLYDAGYTTAEIAEKLKISESTIRSVKHTIDEAKKNGLK